MPKKILIVDDRPEVRRLIELTLQTAGYETVQAETGSEALKLATDEMPDLIFLDIMMPDMSGIDVLARLRSEKRFDNTIIIMLTGMGMELDVQRALQIGANEYITKPFSPMKLLQRVNEIFH